MEGRDWRRMKRGEKRWTNFNLSSSKEETWAGKGLGENARYRGCKCEEGERERARERWGSSRAVQKVGTGETGKGREVGMSDPSTEVSRHIARLSVRKRRGWFLKFLYVQTMFLPGNIYDPRLRNIKF